MIVPSIDLMNGHAVQLVGGKQLELDAGDPRPIAERFALVGEIAVVDLDAAMGRGSNADVIRDLIGLASCRVGGGIRSAEAALEWLDAGATKVVLGTAARPEVLERLPPERVIVALDAYQGEVVVEGWQKGTGRTVYEGLGVLRKLAGGFLVTFIEGEGRMGGIDLNAVAKLRDACHEVQLTVAGGVTTPDEIAAIDQLGAEAQVGMAIYTGRLDLADAIAAPLVSDREDGRWPTVVTDESGVALGLAWSDLASLREAVRRRRGVYSSRSRGLWIKGETSGATQELLRVDLDCDRDALRFMVRQREPGFCHRGTRTCWGSDAGLTAPARRIAERRVQAPAGSYTKRLFNDPALLKSKLLEEAAELAEARTPEEVAAEAADLLYFMTVMLARGDVPLGDVGRVLDRRALRVSRRPGDAKPDRGETT